MIYGDWIGRWGRAFPEKEALVDIIGGRRYTYGKMAADTHRMANFLSRELGIGRGDRVALSLIHISEPTRRRDSSRMPSSA